MKLDLDLIEKTGQTNIRRLSHGSIRGSRSALDVSRRALILALFGGSPVVAGTSDPGGIAQGILMTVGLGALVWLVVLVGLGIKVGHSAASRTVMSIFFVAVGFSPLGFWSYGAKMQRDEIRERDDELRAKNDALVARAEAYLSEKCPTDRRLLAPQLAVASDGLFVDFEFTSPTTWVQLMHADSILRASPFAYIELDSRDATRGPFAVSARKAWWESVGRRIAHVVDEEDLTARLARREPSYVVQVPVREAHARYVLALSDISTDQDRDHGVARAQIRLAERSSDKVAAEYVGLFANLAPAYETPHWERIKPCRGAEVHYSTDRGAWDVVGFFFKEVVKYKPPL